MANDVSNHAKYQFANKKISASADSFKIILMNSAFVFNKDTHATYADVSASEIATGNGYTQNTKTLTGVSVTEDDTGDRSRITFSNVSWAASGGSIGPSAGAIIFDDTTLDDTVMGFIDFGAAQTVTDGGNFNVINIALNLTSVSATAEPSNHFCYQLSVKAIDFLTDVFKIILMNNTFTFNKDTHATLADVTASQLATANGYTQNSKTLAGVALAEDDTNDRARATWSNISWTAAGGSIGPSNGAIIYDDTTVDDTVVGWIGFTEAKTAPDGANLNVNSVAVNAN